MKGNMPMPPFPSLPDPDHLADLHARLPAKLRPLVDYAEGPLRGDGERVLIAACVSALDACTPSAGAHRAYAEMFGDMIEQQAKG